MPSDSPLVGLSAGRPAARPPRWGWLRSQGLGLLCGFGTVALLAIGSVVMVLTRDGASAEVGLDDLTAFFRRPSPAHLWLYLLFPLAGLYALNTTLATWDNLVRRWRAGQRAPTAYAIAVIHLAFLLGLVAHGVGGFWSEERGQVVVTSGWQPLPAFGEVRLTSLTVDALPNGMPRSADVRLEVRRPGGAVEAAQVGYNQPLSEGFGARLALLQQLGQARVARLSSGAEGCVLAEGQRCAVGGDEVALLGLADLPGGQPAALLRAPGPEGAPAERWVATGGLLILRGGRPLALEAVVAEPAVLLRVRETPGNPWALASALVLLAGTLLMWRRLAPRR
jgi:hypothetical protein